MDQGFSLSELNRLKSKSFNSVKEIDIMVQDRVLDNDHFDLF